MNHLQDKPRSPPPAEVAGLAEHLFRQESARLVSVLTRIFGVDRMQLAEDVVQEALIRAMETWPYHGIPKNPAGWLTQTAKNLALDVVRRDKVFRNKEQAISETIEAWAAGSGSADPVRLEQELRDNTLRLMFACCHPMLSQETQTALALKTLCGLGISEIARAFLTTDAAIAKRLTRARQTIRDLAIPFEIPAGAELHERMDSVLQTLYLLFNEGYKASSGENLLKEELCMEAIRLTALLAGHPAGEQPRVHALLALMLMNAGRLPARIGGDGQMLLLWEQDQSLWYQDMVRRGLVHLGRAATGDDLSEYHIQAGIAACHCTARTYDSTNWTQILSLYDLWIAMDESPVIALNRAVAVANVQGPAQGMEAISRIKNRRPLESYYLYYAVLAEFQGQLGQREAAVDNLRKAIALTEVKSERAFMAGKLSRMS